MKRKVTSLVLAMATCCFLYIPVSAVDDNVGHLVYESGEVSEATIEDVDRLIHERNRAIMAGDSSKVDAIMEELYDMGVRPSTADEIAVVSESGVMAAASDTYVLTTSEYTARVNGVTYDIRRIDCAALKGCNLYHTYNISQRTIDASCEAASYDVCKAVGTTVAGVVNPIAGIALTVYDVWKNAVANLTPTSIVDDITASYDVTILEQCEFYSYKVNGIWTPYAATQYVDLEVDATIFGLNYDGGSHSSINNREGTYSATIYAGDEDDYTAEAQLKEYFTTYLCNYDSQVTSIILEDANGDTIYSRGLVCPHNTSEIY